MAHLSLVLDLEGIRCLVVGAGRVAERKIAAFLRAGARVRVVAPRATRRISELARRRLVVWRRGSFRSSDLRGARLVVAATSDGRINRDVARWAARSGAFCNLVDDPDSCTMMMPSVLSRGPMMISVSTGGESPAIARSLRGELARRYGNEYGVYLRMIGALRRRLLATVADRADRRRRYRQLLQAPLLRLLKEGRQAEARSMARAAAGFR
jgi:precorrin-2 dehydrogenase/sirohydrochlorin ferrochelatase